MKSHTQSQAVREVQTAHRNDLTTTLILLNIESVLKLLCSTTFNEINIIFFHAGTESRIMCYSVFYFKLFFHFQY